MGAEFALPHEISLQEDSGAKKLFAGGWFFSPKTPEFYNYRYMTFILPALYENDDEATKAIAELQHDRGWQTLATFLQKNSIGIIVSVAFTTLIDQLNPDTFEWKHFIYLEEKLVPALNDAPFSAWPGGRGRPSKGNEWQNDVKQRYIVASENDLTALVLRQAFFYSYLKSKLRLSLEDPYDVDAFIVGYGGKVVPVEIKEKSPTESNFFGIDAGRILLLLRLCLTSDNNAIYLIREVNTLPPRDLIGWKYVTLADIIMASKLNLQGGGIGMTGGATQTVMLPVKIFKDFSLQTMSEEWLEHNGNLQASVKSLGKALAEDLSRYLQTED